MNTLMRPLLILVVLLIVLVAGGLLFLSTWDIPPPTAKIEKVIPNDRFAR